MQVASSEQVVVSTSGRTYLPVTLVRDGQPSDREVTKDDAIHLHRVGVAEELLHFILRGARRKNVRRAAAPEEVAAAAAVAVPV